MWNFSINKKKKDFVARNKARVATRNMAMSRQKKLDKMDIIELQSEKPKPSFDFKTARTPGRFIFQAKDLQIGYDRPLTKSLNLTFERNQKVAIIGANGIGKTTLLKSLLGIIPPIAGEVERGDYLELGYFEQEVEGGNRQTPLEAVWNAFPALNQAEVRAALARCGLTTKHIESQIQVLSGGEQAKVRFCLLIQEMRKVYKELGIKHSSSLWPILIQMPVLLALFQALSRVDFLKTGHFLWINLGGVDTSFVLPILAAVFTFLSSWLSNKALSEKSGATTGMMYGMPVLIFVFAISAPSGVALYWAVSNAYQVLQTYFLNNPFKIIAEREAVAQAEKDLEGKKRRALKKAQKKKK